MFKMTRQTFGDPIKAVRNATEKSNLQIAVEVAAQAKLLAPVRYGQLRNGISASNTKTTMLLNDNPGDKGEPLNTRGLRGDEAYSGANVEHAVHQEYGTRRSRAQPFLRPAVEIVTQGSKVADIVRKYGREAMGRELK